MSHDNRRLTWTDIITAEPALAELAVEAAIAAALPDHCASGAWYGRHGFKRRMLSLVGWSRREDEWRPRALVPGPHALGDVMRRREEAEPARVAVLAEDIAYRRDWLWSSAAYDTAYQHLLTVIGDCAEGGQCRCWA